MITSSAFQKIPILSIAFNENASIQDLLQVTAVMVVWWLIFFWAFCQALRPLVYGREWLKNAGSRGVL